jgi:hypothetical protein
LNLTKLLMMCAITRLIVRFAIKSAYLFDLTHGQQDPSTSLGVAPPLVVLVSDTLCFTRRYLFNINRVTLWLRDTQAAT